MNAIDTKTVDRIRKLLALANDKGATEAEAQLAAQRAAEIMEAHGLDQATIDLTGGEGEARTKDRNTIQGLAREDWSITLMAACAESCFVSSAPIRTLINNKMKLSGFSLIGRTSGVASCRVLFDYLSRTVIRLSRSQSGSKRYFRFGCGERIAERIRYRHMQAMMKQRREQEQKYQAPASDINKGTALVVILEDYAQKEADLNLDFQYQQSPGTTAHQRALRKIEADETNAKINQLMSTEISWDIAWWMVHRGCTQAEAEKLEARHQKEQSKRSGGSDRSARRETSAEYQQGRRIGDKVGLDLQIKGGQ